MSEAVAAGGTELPDEPAATEHVAEERYDRTRDRDPFPEIAAALLNSADVYDYVRATGMIWPFDPERLKAASYKVSIGDSFVYWDGDEKEHSIQLGKGERFYLEPNSIGFVTTREIFRLPHYIAARFNLRISNVHRGILLGTGPLVDPGFSGRLLVPLHNLTANRYPFCEGEDFAWFEFTKVSANYWDPRHMEDRQEGRYRGEYKPFPRNKLDLSPTAYLAKAWPGPIPSSIPSAIAEYKTFAEESKTAAQNAERTLRRIAWIATIGVVVATLGVVVPALFASFQLVGDVKDSLSELRDRQTSLAWEIERIVHLVNPEQEGQSSEADRMDFEDFRASLSRIEEQLDELRGRLSEP